MLRGYLAKQLDRQPTFNRLMLLWASASMPGLITPEQRDALVAEVFAKQQTDGGWSMSSLGPWQRIDGSALDTKSDGYATGLATFACSKPAFHRHTRGSKRACSGSFGTRTRRRASGGRPR